MADQNELLAEAYKRGLLPPEKKAAYEEAMSRGLVPKISADYKVSDKPPAKPITKLEKLETGFGDLAEGGAQLLSHAVPSSVERGINKFNNYLADKGVPFTKIPEARDGNTGMDELARQREQDYQSKRIAAGESGFDGYRVLGNVANPVNYLPGVGGSGLLRAGLGGAISAALQPVTDGDYAKEKAKQMGTGFALGGAVGATGNALANVARGTTGARRLLMDGGVNLTPGQVVGGVAKRAEEAAKSIPVLGSMIRGGELRAIKDFNKSTINQALGQIGQRLPDGVNAGREAIGAGQQILGRAYDSILPHVTFGMDQNFANELTAIRQTAQEMPEAQSRQFENIIQNRLGKRANPSGLLDGEAYQQVQSELGNISRGYRSSSDAAQRDLGATIDAVATSMRDTLERQNPRYAQQLGNINRAYAMFTRVENAATRRAGSDGLFTPGDLLQAVKSGDRTVRKRSFARGDAMLQNWAQGAHDVLGNSLPDSGTAERAMWDLTGGGALVAMHNPFAAIAAGASMLPYTSPAMRAINTALSRGNPQTRNALANLVQNGVSRLAAPVAAGGAVALPNALNGQ